MIFEIIMTIDADSTEKICELNYAFVPEWNLFKGESFLILKKINDLQKGLKMMQNHVEILK